MGQVCSLIFSSASSKSAKKYASPNEASAGNEMPGAGSKLIKAASPLAVSSMKPDSLEYTFSKLQSTTVTKAPGSIPPNYPIVIEDCSNASLFLLCVSSQVTIDACDTCTIVLGPSEGSVFVRECRNCIIIAAGQQLRLRDCQSLKISLFSSSEPVIETSKDIEFWIFHMEYAELKGQFNQAGLLGKSNKWNLVHDFNPSSRSNFTLNQTKWHDSVHLNLPSQEFIDTVRLDIDFPKFKPLTTEI